MEWPVVLALVLVIPLILLPAALIWFMNIKGIRDAVKEKRTELLEVIRRRGRLAVAVIIPLGIYAFLIWFFLGRFGWGVALAAALVLPIVFFVPVLIWASVASGLTDVLRDRMRRRATASRRRAAATPLAVEEPK